ncbi:peptidase [Gloeopeniophorella convolvens]|nr:peptidase [Gloeopeniophorella convolvens]
MKSFQPLLALVYLAAAVTASPASFRVEHAAERQFQLAQSQGNFAGWGLDEMRLVQLAPGAEPVWMSEKEKIEAKAAGLKFMDITDAMDLGALNAMKVQPSGELSACVSRSIGRPRAGFPKPGASKDVKRVIEKLSSEGPQANLEEFTSFRTRYYRSQTGQESQRWLTQKILEITKTFAPKGLRNLISVTEFPHSWGQNSIIVRINGSAPTNEGVVIIGAHQDSANLSPFLPAPGADDDGSGTVTILEAYRALIASDFRPVEHVEFHWYAAEEYGLLGSQAVAKDYEAKHVNVIAMNQFDMTAWVKSGTREEVGIMIEFVDPDVTAFNKQLIDAYLDIPYVETTCGWACSDHASWNKAGYRSSFSFESAFENINENVHSINDRIDISPEFSFSHMLEFSKLAVAFSIELGGWKENE